MLACNAIANKRCRMDIAFKSPWFSFDKASPDRMYIPDFHHWRSGINDRFCIAPPDLIENYVNILDEVYKEPGKCSHAEYFLKYCLIKSRTPIELVPIFFNRVREGGEVIVDAGENTLQYPKELLRTGTL